MARPQLPPANVCIYCQSEEHDGSVEHIVPEGLNGRMELPNATCAVCKQKINRSVEGPLQEVLYKRSRLAFGYKSKRRGRRRQKKQPVVNARNSWSLVAKLNLPPFEMVVSLELPEHPVTYVQYFYPAPPFLLALNPEMRNTEIPGINHPQKLADMNARAARWRPGVHRSRAGRQEPLVRRGAGAGAVETYPRRRGQRRSHHRRTHASWSAVAALAPRTRSLESCTMDSDQVRSLEDAPPAVAERRAAAQWRME